MKRASVRLVAATVRTGLLVGFVLILILVLFPAAMAQAAGPR
jgi:tetrahydromethanopterin S-methyltransferase subunit F